MKSEKQISEFLPWNNGELESQLREVIDHGTETSKIDYKLEIIMNSPEQKSELLKDISAIANTYDDKFNDYGFIVYGVKPKEIVGIKQTEIDTDKFQSSIEQLLKSNISPTPKIYVIGFRADEKNQWGVIVISPDNNKPHMFCKDFNCTDKSKSRKKGEWFVRRGSTTDVGLPEDLVIIMQRQTDLLLDPLRESIRTLQTRVAKTEDQYNSALFKLVERAVSALPAVAERNVEEKEKIDADIGEVLDMDLPARLKQKLRTPKDALAEDLIAEAKKIRDFIDGADTGLPWAPQLNNADENKKIINDLEDKIKDLQLSIATVILNDSKGTYTEALLRAIKLLAKSSDVPSGTAFNRIGEAIRYYPLGTILYTIFICGAAANRGDILKKVLDIPLKHQRRSATSHITDIFFYWWDAKALFNHAYSQRWCEPISQRIRQLLSDHISEMITDFTEPEYFFRGEFVLALANIEKCINEGKDAENRMPLPGLYLYMHEASEPISDFVLEHLDWFDKLYNNPLSEILEAFDSNSHKMANQNSFADGIRGLKTAELYQMSLENKTKVTKQTDTRQK
jgi:hypothetical protein